LLYWKWLRDTFYSVRVTPGEQVAINSRTGRIAIKYQLGSSDKSFQTDPQDCSGGRVIFVP
jgi:hypothetical protein